MTNENVYDRLTLSFGQTTDIDNNPTQFSYDRARGMNSDQLSTSLIRTFEKGYVEVGSVRVPLLAPIRDPPVLVQVLARFRDKNPLGVITTYRVRFKMTAHEMYLVAFKGGAKDSKWYECDAKNEKTGQNVKGTLLKGSTQLGMTGSYSSSRSIGANAFLSGTNPETKEEEIVRYRDALVLNRYTTSKHIKYLHSYNRETEKTYGNVAKALVYMAQLFAEMPRFKKIQDHVRPQWFNENYVNEKGEPTAGLGKPLDSDVIEQQNMWANFSFEVQMENPSEDKAKLLGIAKKIVKTDDPKKKIAKTHHR